MVLVLVTMVVSVIPLCGTVFSLVAVLITMRMTVNVGMNPTIGGDCLGIARKLQVMLDMVGFIRQ